MHWSLTIQHIKHSKNKSNIECFVWKPKNWIFNELSYNVVVVVISIARNKTSFEMYLGVSRNLFFKIIIILNPFDLWPYYCIIKMQISLITYSIHMWYCWSVWYSFCVYLKFDLQNHTQWKWVTLAYVKKLLFDLKQTLSNGTSILSSIFLDTTFQPIEIYCTCV